MRRLQLVKRRAVNPCHLGTRRRPSRRVDSRHRPVCSHRPPPPITVEHANPRRSERPSLLKSQPAPSVPFSPSPVSSSPEITANTEKHRRLPLLPVLSNSTAPPHHSPVNPARSLLTKPTDGLPTFPEPSSPFPESSSGRTKLHRAAFVFTDDLHVDSLPQRLPSSKHSIVSTPYLP